MSIKIFDLSQNKFAYESVPAERFMRFLYGNCAGRLALWAMFKRAAFSKICGAWAASGKSKKAVLPFIKKHAIDTDEMLYAPENFKCFNDFFTRALKRGARPIENEGDDGAVSFPSDGRHLLIENVSAADSFYAKGQKFDMASFLGDAKLAEAFGSADMLISRLAPVDYHRFHFPVSGEIAARRAINGALYSVSPIALIPRLRVLWENRRVLNIIENGRLGFCAFVEIGATNVGGIVNSANVGDFVERGGEAGYFNFGGSCVVSIFPGGKIEWNAALRQMSRANIECYARACRAAGTIK